MNKIDRKTNNFDFLFVFFFILVLTKQFNMKTMDADRLFKQKQYIDCFLLFDDLKSIWDYGKSVKSIQEWKQKVEKY